VATVSHLSADEAAAHLGVSRTTLYAYVSRGLVTSEPVPGSRERRYPRSALDALKARRRDGRDPTRWASLESSITLIDGERLWYRGRDACELSRSATLEEVAALLWTGTTEGAETLFPVENNHVPGQEPRRGLVGETAAAADRLIAALVSERARHPLSLSEPTEPTFRAAARTVSALFDAVGASGDGTLAERLARGWSAPSADDLRAALVLCADHGLSTSAFTARCVASTDAPLHNALLGALCALEGRRHGGAATGEIADLLDDVARLGAERGCGRVLAQRGRLPGFGGGGGAYRRVDPRAQELLGRLELAPTDPAAQAIEFARGFGGEPSVELALAALVRRAGLARDAAFALFALGRSVGWVAHAFEAAAAGTLIRPRARYSGPPPQAIG
jgi:citrate synthase